MRRYSGKYRFLKIVSIGLLVSCNLSAQWSLRDCIDYAQQENIQVKKSQISVAGYTEDLKMNKSALFPSLSASVSQSFSNRKMNDGQGNYKYDGTFDGEYGLSSNWVIANGKRNLNAIKESRLNIETSELDKEEILNNIEISITQTYLQVIYAWESIANYRNIEASTQVQLVQSKTFLDAGSITLSEYAQVEAQLSADKYNLVLAENSYKTYKLQLKQLLELEIDQEFEVSFPKINDSDVLNIIPEKEDVYRQALEIMPQIKSKELGVDIAKLNKSSAKGGYLPTLSIQGSVGTGNIYGESPSFSSQLGRNFGQQLALTLSVPIYDNRKAKTAVKKAELQIENAHLDYLNSRKELLRTVEGLYQDAISGQSKYKAALDKLKSAELSYTLVQEQYSLGLRNTVEITTEKNNYTNALQEFLQAKYTALLSLKLLNFYQGQQITI